MIDPQDEALAGEVGGLLRRLIACDTSNPPGNETHALALLEEYLLDAGLDCERVCKNPDRANLVRPARHRPGPSLGFLGHLDVVPADRTRWSVDPFAGIERDGVIWGRGAVDMKCQVAATCVAPAANSARQGFAPQGNLMLRLSTSDEEGGAGGGRSTYLVEARRSSARPSSSVKAPASATTKRSVRLPPRPRSEVHSVGHADPCAAAPATPPYRRRPQRTTRADAPAGARRGLRGAGAHPGGNRAVDRHLGARRLAPCGAARAGLHDAPGLPASAAQPRPRCDPSHHRQLTGRRTSFPNRPPRSSRARFCRIPPPRTCNGKYETPLVRATTTSRWSSQRGARLGARHPGARGHRGLSG